VYNVKHFSEILVWSMDIHYITECKMIFMSTSKYSMYVKFWIFMRRSQYHRYSTNIQSCYGYHAYFRKHFARHQWKLTYGYSWDVHMYWYFQAGTLITILAWFYALERYNKVIPLSSFLNLKPETESVTQQANQLYQYDDFSGQSN